MPLHVPQRLHVAYHSLWRRGDAAETRALFNQTKRGFDRLGFSGEADDPAVIEHFHALICEALAVADHPQTAVTKRFIDQLFHHESLFVLPQIDWSETRSTADWWGLRDALLRQKALVQDFAATEDHIITALTIIITALYCACPSLLEQDTSHKHSIDFPIKAIDQLQTPKDMTQRIMEGFAVQIHDQSFLFPKLAARLEYNLIEASGSNPLDPRGLTKPPIMPLKSTLSKPHELVGTYLSGTPIPELLDQEIAFSIHEAPRFEHHHIVAGSGHGKTQTLQYLIAHDLLKVRQGQASVIVIDSQGDLIRKIKALDMINHDNLVLIDPTDIDYPVCLNLFDVQMDRINAYSRLHREQMLNGILELFDFVLGSLLGAEMTQKQSEDVEAQESDEPTPYW